MHDLKPQRWLVSVIMPARNTERYVGAALESVLAQTYSALEVLVVDDGSSDGTSGVAQRYADRDRRVRLIRGRFGSAAAARNQALEVARGDLFALLDSDDLWAPTFLERQLDLLTAYPGAMLASGNAVNLGGLFHGRPLDARGGVRVLSFEDLIRDETSVCIMTVFRREVVTTVGHFDGSLSTNEDYDLWLRATHAGFLIVKDGRALGYYRRRPESLSFDEDVMLGGILRVFRNVETWNLLPQHRAILERQIARFERRRMVVQAKAALAARDFARAQMLFGAAARRGDWKAAVAAIATRRWPEPFLRAVSRRGRRPAPAPGSLGAASS